MNIEKPSSTILMLSIVHQQLPSSLQIPMRLSIHLPSQLDALFSVVTIISSRLGLVPAAHGCAHALVVGFEYQHWRRKPRLLACQEGTLLRSYTPANVYISDELCELPKHEGK